MSFLKRVSETADRLIIKDMLHARLGGPEKARSQQHIHSSDLTKQDNQWGEAYCPREVRIRQELGKKRRDQFLQVATQVTFDEGRDKQARLNNDWLRDVMWGRWQCQMCYEVVENDFAPKDGVCPNPDCLSIDLMEYVEPRIIDAVTGTGGGLDALVDVGKKKLRIIEVKIMKADDFKDLHAPLSEHRVRTKLYLRLVAGSDQKWAKKVNTKFAHILYIMRGHGVKQDDGRISPFKEFIIERDDSEIMHYLGMAHALKLSRDHEGLYPCGICATQMDGRAKKCPVAKECFSSKFPANITWHKEGTPVHTGDHIKLETDGESVNECSG